MLNLKSAYNTLRNFVKKTHVESKDHTQKFPELDLAFPYN